MKVTLGPTQVSFPMWTTMFGHVVFLSCGELSYGKGELFEEEHHDDLRPFYEEHLDYSVSVPA